MKEIKEYVANATQILEGSEQVVQNKTTKILGDGVDEDENFEVDAEMAEVELIEEDEAEKRFFGAMISHGEIFTQEMEFLKTKKPYPNALDQPLTDKGLQ